MGEVFKVLFGVAELRNMDFFMGEMRKEVKGNIQLNKPDLVGAPTLYPSDSIEPPSPERDGLSSKIDSALDITTRKRSKPIAIHLWLKDNNKGKLNGSYVDRKGRFGELEEEGSFSQLDFHVAGLVLKKRFRELNWHYFGGRKVEELASELEYAPADTGEGLDFRVLIGSTPENMGKIMGRMVKGYKGEVYNVSLSGDFTQDSERLVETVGGRLEETVSPYKQCEMMVNIHNTIKGMEKDNLIPQIVYLEQVNNRGQFGCLCLDSKQKEVGRKTTGELNEEMFQALNTDLRETFKHYKWEWKIMGEGKP